MSTEHPESSPSLASQPRITIVEDDRDCRELLRMALEAEGFAVSDVSSALRLISTLYVDEPDLLVLDVIMSWIDGFELCRALKRNDRFKHIPIVIVTGKSEPEDVEAGFAAGATDYFTKPLNLRKFCQRVREILESEST